MRLVLKQYKRSAGSSVNRGTYRRYFDERANIEALEREIAARIEADHDRAGWW